jgi:hypothetical protein
MNVDRARIHALVQAAADELNATLPAESRIAASDATLLNADGSQLTSLSIIAFIVAIEEKVSDAFGRPVLLFDEAMLVDPNGPYRTIGTLIDHIERTVRTSSR